MSQNNKTTTHSKPPKERMTVTVDPGIKEALQKLADEDDRSLSEYVNRVLKRYVREHSPE